MIDGLLGEGYGFSAMGAEVVGFLPDYGFPFLGGGHLSIPLIQSAQISPLTGSFKDTADHMLAQFKSLI